MTAAPGPASPSFPRQAAGRQAGRERSGHATRYRPAKGGVEPATLPRLCWQHTGLGNPHSPRGAGQPRRGCPLPCPSTEQLQAGDGRRQAPTSPPTRRCPPALAPPPPYPQRCQPADDHLQGAVGALDEDQGLLAGPVQRCPADVHQLIARLQPAGQRSFAPVLHLGDRAGCQGDSSPPEHPGGCATAFGCQKDTSERGACAPGTVEGSAAPGSLLAPVT